MVLWWKCLNAIHAAKHTVTRYIRDKVTNYQYSKGHNDQKRLLTTVPFGGAYISSHRLMNNNLHDRQWRMYNNYKTNLNKDQEVLASG